jgi:transposase
MGYIQGRARTQSCMFPAALEEAIAADSMVRVIDAFVEMLDVAALGFDKAHSAPTGRPPYDPKDLLKLYLYGYLNRVRASRALEREVARNIELMWLVNTLAPDFKTIADFRKDNAKAIVGVCRSLVLFCRDQKLLGGKRVAIDGSKFEAAASRKRVWTSERIERTVRAIDRDIAEYLQQMDEQDAQHAARLSLGDAKAALLALQARRDELQALAAQLHDSGERQHIQGEPDAKLMRTAHGNHKVAYNVQIAVDEQHHLIVAQALTNEGNDHTQLEPMAKASQEILQAEALSVIADTGYHNGKQAQGCEQAGITPIVPAPVCVNPRGADLYTAEQFRYDPQGDCYTCPAEQVLTLIRTDQRNELRHYSTNACSGCALKANCTRGQKRTLIRSFYAEARERMSARAAAQPELRTLRSSVVEHPFGTLKYQMGTARFLVRGMRKAAAEIALSVTGYNLKRLIAVLGISKLLAALRAREYSPAWTA